MEMKIVMLVVIVGLLSGCTAFGQNEYKLGETFEVEGFEYTVTKADWEYDKNWEDRRIITDFFVEVDIKNCQDIQQTSSVVEVTFEVYNGYKYRDKYQVEWGVYLSPGKSATIRLTCGSVDIDYIPVTKVHFVFYDCNNYILSKEVLREVTVNLLEEDFPFNYTISDSISFGKRFYKISIIDARNYGGYYMCFALFTDFLYYDVVDVSSGSFNDGRRFIEPIFIISEGEIPQTFYYIDDIGKVYKLNLGG